MHKAAPHHVRHFWRPVAAGTAPLLAYSALSFFFFVGDGIMSYTAPVFIEHLLKSPLLMGLVISSSSMAGLVCDLFFSQLFRGRSYAFYAFLMFIIALGFPLVFLFLPPIVIFFIIAMVIWGIYFEFMRFSHYNFVYTFMQVDDHSTAWGILEVFRACAATIAPVLAGILIDRQLKLPFYGALFGFTIGLFSLLLFVRTFHNPRKTPAIKVTHKAPPSFLRELKIWKILLGRIWPLYLFNFALVLLDTGFWTVGTLLSEELRAKSAVGALLIPAYVVPSLFIPLFAHRAAKLLGKKRAAFLAGIPAGLILAFGAWVEVPIVLVCAVFVSSIFVALAGTEIYATFEDYVARLKGFGDDMVGLDGSGSSLGYIIGPVVAGAIASLDGNHLSFIVFGILVSVSAVVGLVCMPRKTRLPQAQLEAEIG